MKRALSAFLAALMLILSSLTVASAAASIKISVTPQGSKYIVKWTYKQKNLTGFTVYVDGKYDGIKKITSAGTYSFTTDPYTTGMAHTIQLKAYINKSVAASSDKVTSVLLPAVPTVTSAGNSTGFTLSEKCSGKYGGISLYLYDSVSGKYKFYKNFNKTLKVTSSSAMTFKARSFVTVNKKNYYSSYTKPFACAPQLESVTMKSAASNAVGKITLSWITPKYSFTAYQIAYTSFDNFTYPHFLIASKTSQSATLTLKAGVCYKVCIRAYRISGGVKRYGRWSAVKTLYTKANVPVTADSKTLLNKSLKLSASMGTGCQRLNNALDRIIKKTGCRSASVSTQDKLKAIYRYIATEQFKTNGSLGATGSSSYNTYPESAVLRMLENKGKTGSCYEYNYLFMYLCRRLGVKDAYISHGSVPLSGSGRTEHYWTMIKVASNNYFFDPRMQRYVSGKGYNFFCLPLNGGNYYSNYYRFCDAQATLK